jgi:hypothetical protein
LFGTIPVAFAVGWIAQSEDVFIAVMGVGLIVNVVLGRTVLR